MAFEFEKIKKGLKKAWEGDTTGESVLGIPQQRPTPEPTVKPVAPKPAAKEPEYDEYVSEISKLKKRNEGR